MAWLASGALSCVGAHDDDPDAGPPVGARPDAGPPSVSVSALLSGGSAGPFALQGEGGRIGVREDGRRLVVAPFGAATLVRGAPFPVDRPADTDIAVFVLSDTLVLESIRVLEDGFPADERVDEALLDAAIARDGALCVLAAIDRDQAVAPQLLITRVAVDGTEVRTLVDDARAPAFIAHAASGGCVAHVTGPPPPGEAPPFSTTRVLSVDDGGSITWSAATGPATSAAPLTQLSDGSWAVATHVGSIVGEIEGVDATGERFAASGDSPALFLQRFSDAGALLDSAYHSSVSGRADVRLRDVAGDSGAGNAAITWAGSCGGLGAAPIACVVAWDVALGVATQREVSGASSSVFHAIATSARGLALAGAFSARVGVGDQELIGGATFNAFTATADEEAFADARWLPGMISSAADVAIENDAEVLLVVAAGAVHAASATDVIVSATPALLVADATALVPPEVPGEEPGPTPLVTWMDRVFGATLEATGDGVNVLARASATASISVAGGDDAPLLPADAAGDELVLVRFAALDQAPDVEVLLDPGPDATFAYSATRDGETECVAFDVVGEPVESSTHVWRRTPDGWLESFLQGGGAVVTALAGDRCGAAALWWGETAATYSLGVTDPAGFTDWTGVPERIDFVDADGEAIVALGWPSLASLEIAGVTVPAGSLYTVRATDGDVTVRHTSVDDLFPIGLAAVADEGLATIDWDTAVGFAAEGADSLVERWRMKLGASSQASMRRIYGVRRRIDAAHVIAFGSTYEDIRIAPGLAIPGATAPETAFALDLDRDGALHQAWWIGGGEILDVAETPSGPVTVVRARGALSMSRGEVLLPTEAVALVPLELFHTVRFFEAEDP